ncbi:MAG: putative adhesin [Actinocrinis sp.]
MSGIAKAIEDGVKQVAEHVGSRLGPKLKEFIEDTKNGMVKSAENTAKTEAENTRAITGIMKDGERGVSGDAERAATGLRPGEGERGLGGGRGGGQGSEGNGGVETGGTDPVDVVSGQMVTSAVDVDLAGLLPLILRRAYASGYGGGRLLGPGWSGTLDQRLEIDEDGVHYAGDDAQILHFPVPAQPGMPVLPADGARWRLSHDRGSDTYRVEDPESGWTRHFAAGQADPDVRPISALTDRNGNRVTYAHDRDGLPVAIGHSGGYRVNVDTTYTAGGYRIEKLRMADGTELVEYRYDALGRLSGIVNSSGLPYIYEYDDSDRITTWIDRNSHGYAYTYDDAGRVVAGVGPGGRLSSTLAYDLDNRVTTVTNSLGHSTKYHYDANGHITETVDALGNATLTEYDRYGRVVSLTDPLGSSTRREFDQHGNPSRVERPDGTAIQLAYGALPRPVRVVGPDGATWRHAYDERGNLESTSDPSGAETRHAYDESGILTATTDALGNVTHYQSSPAGLTLRVTNALGAQAEITHDAFGRVASVTDPTGAQTRLGWTREGRPAWRITPDGQRAQWAYDAEGNLLEHRDANGGTTTFEYGPFDKPVSRTDPGGNRYAFAYDTELRLVAVTSPQGQVWRYTYDEADNLLSETDFDGRTVTYRYDAAGQVVERVNGAGESTVFVRNQLGLVTERRCADRDYRFAYDAAGLMSHADGPDGALEYTRDRLGRVLSESWDGRTLVAEYDGLGRRVRRVAPSGAVSDWSYDAAGAPVGLSTAAGALSFQYDAAGRETTRYLGVQAALSQRYDDAGRLSTQAIWAYDQGAVTTSEPTLQQERTYAYRADGYPVEITDQLRGTRRYDLDQAGRVTAVHAATWSESYAYDTLGNLTQAVVPGDQDRQGELQYAGTLIRSSGRTTYEHDAQGRIVRSSRRTLSGQTKQWTYSWDADDHLVQATTADGAVWQYGYDPLGRRTGKRRLAADGAVAEEVQFSWDGARLAEQRTVRDGQAEVLTWDWDPGTHHAAAQTRRRFSAQSPQAEVDAAFYAIVTDLIGAPSELVAADGRIAWHRSTSLWGAPIAVAGDGVDCPLGFPGQYQDLETGLSYNYFRYYDPATARYASPDPLGLDAGPNNRLYTDNPLVWADPLGLCPSRGAPTFITDANGNTSVRGPGRPDGDLVLSGHGAISSADTSMVTVPQGTTLHMYSNHGTTISDSLGNKIETGNPTPLHTYNAGDQVPDYHLFPPGGGGLPKLNIKGSPVTVTGPTRLSDLLKPNMDSVHWAACRETVAPAVVNKFLNATYP